MEFTSDAIPYGPQGLQGARDRALRLVTATAERFGYKVTTDASYEVTGDESGGTVVVHVVAHPVSHSW